MFAGTIPSVGEGRTQRYPKEAFAVFTQIRQENLAGRGGKARATKMSATKSPRKKTAKRPLTVKKGTSVKVGSRDLRGGPQRVQARKATDREEAGSQEGKYTEARHRTRYRRLQRRSLQANRQSREGSCWHLEAAAAAHAGSQEAGQGDDWRIARLGERGAPSLADRTPRRAPFVLPSRCPRSCAFPPRAAPGQPVSSRRAQPD